MQRIVYSSSFIPCENQRTVNVRLEECSPLTGTNVSWKIKTEEYSAAVKFLKKQH